MILLAFCVGFIFCAFLILLIILAIPARARPKSPLPHRRRYRDATDYDVGCEAAFPRDVHEESEQ